MTVETMTWLEIFVVMGVVPVPTIGRRATAKIISGRFVDRHRYTAAIMRENCAFKLHPCQLELTHFIRGSEHQPLKS